MYTGPDIFRRMHAHATATQSLEDAQLAANELTEAQARVAEAFAHAQHVLSQFWQGDSADAANAGMNWHVHTSELAHASLATAANSIDAQVGSFHGARAPLVPMANYEDVPSPIPLNKAKIDTWLKWVEDNQHNIKKYQSYVDAEQLNSGKLGWQYFPVQSLPSMWAHETYLDLDGDHGIDGPTQAKVGKEGVAPVKPPNAPIQHSVVDPSALDNSSIVSPPPAVSHVPEQPTSSPFESSGHSALQIVDALAGSEPGEELVTAPEAFHPTTGVVSFSHGVPVGSNSAVGMSINEQLPRSYEAGNVGSVTGPAPKTVAENPNDRHAGRGTGTGNPTGRGGVLRAGMPAATGGVNTSSVSPMAPGATPGSTEEENEHRRKTPVSGGDPISLFGADDRATPAVIGIKPAPPRKS